MSITDGLREYVQDWRETPNLMDDLDAGDVDGILADFEHIADLIDAEHERVCNEQYACGVGDGISASIDASMIQEHGFIELPKDADGEYIHFGDVLDQFGTPMTVVAMTDPDPNQGDCMLELITDVASDSIWVRARKMRHHHVQTVENVLREFAAEFVGCANEVDDHEVTDAIERFASKLRLAGSVDE